MAKEHKYHRSRIEIDTSLPVERALSLARQTADARRGIRVLGEDGEVMSAAVTSVLGAKLVHFTVSARATSGRTRVTTEILRYQTSQSTYGFIPIGPKSMDGYSQYRGYMRALHEVFSAADPSARGTITEREVV